MRPAGAGKPGTLRRVLPRWRSGHRAGRRVPPVGALLGLLVAAVLALLITDRPAESQSLQLGDENSWIRIQNVGGAPAAVDLQFYDLQGNPAGADACPRSGACDAISPGSGWSFFQQGFTGLPAGYRGSAYVTSTQPFVAILARDVMTGNTFKISGDTLPVGSGGTLHYLPWVANNAAYVSRISVQNTSEDFSACVQLSYYRDGSTSVAAIDPASASPECPQGGQLVQPRGTFLRNENNLPVTNFEGAAVARLLPTTAGTSGSAASLSVIIDTRSRTGAGLATSRAIAETELGQVIVLPLIERSAADQGSARTTRFRIMTGTPGTPTEVTLLFRGADGAGNEVEIEHSLAVSGVLTCDQRLDGAGGCLPADRTLPAGFTGSVRIQAAQPVAIVAQRLGANGSFADYRGFTSEDASREVVLPVLNKNYGPFGGNSGWNSSFRVTTFDGSTANVRVIYYSRRFPSGLVANPVAVAGQRTFRQADYGPLPDGWVGSAILIADRPIVVAVNLESDVFRGDPSMLYGGVGLE